jgi:DNA-binding transcriptional LysR family regulator
VRKDLEKGRLVYAWKKTLTCQDNYYVAVPDNKQENPQINDFLEWVRREIAPEMQAGSVHGE